MPLALPTVLCHLLGCSGWLVACLVFIGDASQWQCHDSLQLFSGFDLILPAYLSRMKCHSFLDLRHITPSTHSDDTMYHIFKNLLTNEFLFLWQGGGPQNQIHRPSHSRDKNKAPRSLSGLWGVAGRGDPLRALD